MLSAAVVSYQPAATAKDDNTTANSPRRSRYMSSKHRLTPGSRIVLSLATAAVLLALSIVGSSEHGLHSPALASAAPLTRHTPVQHLSSQNKRQIPSRLGGGGRPQAEEDPCRILGQLEEPYVTWTHVQQCYENVPYNVTEANTILSTLYTLYRDYYIFLDMAMLENQPKPFTNPPVDILQGLDLISQQEYHSDFQFQTDVEILVSRLNDAHANYLAFCYRHYLFVQPFELYAPVANNVQTVRILVDKSFNDLEECQVLTIDGINALDAIQNYIDVNSAISKDAGVRLNKALTANTFNADTKEWTLNPGLFTSRATLPERQTMVYHIQCPASAAHPHGREERLNVDWEVYRLVSWNSFESTESFLNRNCYSDTDPNPKKSTRQHSGRVSQERRKVKESWKPAWEGSVQEAVDIPRHETIKSLPSIEKRQYVKDEVAWMIFNGTTTAFYQLAKRPSIGVVVIPTHSVNLEIESKIMVEGFERLYESGVRNVILDMTSNGGGYVTFAYDLVDWMFPTDNQTSVYQSDLRASMSAKAIAQVDLTNDDYSSYFNPSSFSDIGTHKDFETNFFLQDQLIRRAHRRLNYTPKVFMNHNLGALEMGMPWQNDAQRIVIMTDGACGSACGMSLNRLKNTHGVQSYAVGGRVGEDLSMFSFPGASVYGLDSLLNDFENLGVDSPMQRIRYKGIFRVPILEFFQEGDPVPIEYNPKLYTADFHLDYTPVTARHHEVLWEIVANNHWREDGETGDDPSIEKKLFQ
ncbi:hypothetical protein BGZ58_007005 [Dissophora ornata]|nr:hypothetical protein BGZ58_007005 [Dissophora ornata]